MAILKCILWSSHPLKALIATRKATRIMFPIPIIMMDTSSKKPDQAPTNQLLVTQRALASFLKLIRNLTLNNWLGCSKCRWCKWWWWTLLCKEPCLPNTLMIVVVVARCSCNHQVVKWTPWWWILCWWTKWWTTLSWTLTHSKLSRSKSLSKGRCVTLPTLRAISSTLDKCLMRLCSLDPWHKAAFPSLRTNLCLRLSWTT